MKKIWLQPLDKRKKPIVVLPHWVSVMALASDGWTREETADHLNISSKTVEGIIYSFCHRMDCHNKTHLVATLMRQKIIN